MSFFKKNSEVLKLHVNNSSFFEISASLLSKAMKKVSHLKVSKLNKGHEHLSEEIPYLKLMKLKV